MINMKMHFMKTFLFVKLFALLFQILQKENIFVIDNQWQKKCQCQTFFLHENYFHCNFASVKSKS